MRRATPVVFVHGGPGMYTEAGRFEEKAVMRDAGFNTVFFDQAGGGKSLGLKAGDCLLDRGVADIEALRIALGKDRLVLWGNSFGDDLAALYAGRYPGRVAGMVLTSPGMIPGYAGKRNYGRTDRKHVEYSKAITKAIDTIDRDGAAAETELPHDAAGKLFDSLFAAELIDGMVCIGTAVRPAALPGGGNFYAQRLIARDLKALKVPPVPVAGVPTFVIGGTCDLLPMTSAEHFRDLFGGTIVQIAGSGHGLYENRAVIDAAIADFARTALASVE